MIKKFVPLIFALLLIFYVSCSEKQEETPSKFHFPEIGETSSTVFFDFTVDDITLSDTSADVTVTVKNNGTNAVKVYPRDFWLEWNGGSANVVDTQETTDLEPDAEVVIHFIYEIPSVANEFAFIHTEAFSSGEFGDSYTVKFTRQ